MIVFSPPVTRYTVTVFTDVDCGYCAKLHRELDSYLAEGIAIRYIAFPRAGIPSQSYDEMVSVWCSADPRKAIGDAKARRPVEPKVCDNPVAKQYEMGRLVGVRGTPTIIMETGDVIPGYMPAAQLRQAIEEAKAEASAS
jgi:thiol:disulfide interchange protein DsbC